jgi:hypothetical protein
MPCRIATRKGNHGKGPQIEKIHLLNLKTVGFLENNVLVAAAGDQRAHVPAHPVEPAGLAERARLRVVLGKRAAHGGAEHGLEVGGRAGRIGEQWCQCGGKIGVGEIPLAVGARRPLMRRGSRPVPTGGDPRR